MESAIKMEMPEEEIDIVRLGMDIEELLSPGNELPEDQMEYMSEDECKANTPIGNFSSRDVNQRQSSLLLDNTNLSNSELSVRSELLEIENWELAEQDKDIGCSKEVKDSLKNIEEEQTELSLHSYKECTIAANEPKIDANKTKFMCPQCPKAYKNKSTLKSHIRTHTCERPFQCPHCPKAFKQSMHLRNHISNHEGKAAFKCPHCRKYFIEKAKYDEHTRCHIGHRLYKCPHCSKICSDQTRFKKHILIHHANNSEINVQSELLEIENWELAEQENQIDFSKEVKDSEVNIKEEQTELSSNSYEECTVERYEIGNPLAVDEPRIDAKKKQFICPQCQKACKNTSSLNVHIRLHSSERPFPCPHCPKTFKTFWILRCHISTHKGKTALKCPHCRRYFLEKAKYDEHTRFHIGHRAYKCLHCPKIFTTISFFKAHILIHPTNNSEVDVQSERVEIENSELAGQDNEIGCSNEVKDKEDIIEEEQTEISLQNYEECHERHEICDPLAVDEPRIDAKKKQYLCPQCQKAFKTKFMLTSHLRTHSNE